MKCEGKEKNQLSFYYLDLFFISMYLIVELRVHIYIYISMFEYLHIYIYMKGGLVDCSNGC
jgi:hypothetical protein